MNLVYEFTMGMNGYDLPATAEYEIDPDSGGIVIFAVVIASRTVGDMYSPKGEYLGVGRQTVDVTRILSAAEIADLASEIDEKLRDDAAENEAANLAADGEF